MQHNQVPTIAKIRLLEGALSARRNIVLLSDHNPDMKREYEYQVEVVQAILDDYRQKAKIDGKPGEQNGRD